jgi:mRNA interferase MazF
MIKDFTRWNNVKQNIDTGHTPPLFNQRDIWWCSIGINIGYEIFGKGQNFTRPVLIIKKYSALSFLGVPMTSQLKPLTPYLYPIDCKGKESLLLLSQIRSFDARRLHQKIERIGQEQFDAIKNAIKQSL